MKRAIALIAPVLAASCSGSDRDPTAAEAARRNAGTALVAKTVPASAGERLFQAHCAMCHDDGKLYPGTVGLRHNGQTQPVLARRTDLDADYVRQVARLGLGAMPPFTPIQLSDADLDSISHWLAAKK